MKKLILLFVLPLVISSCTTSSEELSISEELRTNLSVRKVLLDELEKDMSAELGVPIKYESSEILEMDGRVLFRGTSGDYVITSALLRDKTGRIIREIECITQSCGQGGGCVPFFLVDPPICTPCTLGTKDCLRKLKGVYLSE